MIKFTHLTKLLSLALMDAIALEMKGFNVQSPLFARITNELTIPLCSLLPAGTQAVCLPLAGPLDRGLCVVDHHEMISLCEVLAPQLALVFSLELTGFREVFQERGSKVGR